MARELSLIRLDPPLLRYYQWDFSVFSSASKNHLEIGFGNGQYLVDMAAKRPFEAFFGIEQSRKYFEKALKKSQGFSLKNVKLFLSEAKACLGIFPDEFFDEVHINFPDPWPKKKHTQRRIADDSFACEINRVLKKNGLVLIATDSNECFLNIVLIFLRNSFSSFCSGDEARKKRISKTKYEKDFTAKGITIFYSILKKS